MIWNKDFMNPSKWNIPKIIVWVVIILGCISLWVWVISTIFKKGSL